MRGRSGNYTSQPQPCQTIGYVCGWKLDIGYWILYTYPMRSFRRRIGLRYDRQKLVLYGLIGLIGLILIGFIFSFAAFAWYARDLPSPGKLSQGSDQSTVFLDRDDKVLFEMYKDKNRVPVDSKDIALIFKQATVAIEDKNFYKHSGISETGILRAVFSIVTGKGLQGGSTLTQQLIKNVLLTSEQRLSRKIKEAILAREVERRYTKDEILGMYLNEAPYGGSYYGVGSAAKGYFDKNPRDLTLVESAILAGLPQSPSYYSPYIGKENAWKGRAQDVLRRMREDKYITKDQEDKAVKDLEKVKFGTPKLAITAPHFVFYVREQLEKEYGPKVLDQGLRIKTTLSRDVQEKAEKIVHDEIVKLKSAKAGNGAAVVIDSKSGDILAYVGSYDFNDEDYGKFDVVSQGLRQPGSTLKPITYATAFEKGYTPATVLMDLKTVFPNSSTPDYVPVNYDGQFRGPIQIRFALGSSLNVPAVKMLSMIGLKDFLTKAEEMGIKQLAPTQKNMDRFGLAITLGGGETTLLDLTSAYTVFAAGGIRREPQYIEEITDSKGKKIFKRQKPAEKKVLSPEVSFLISHILSDNNARSLAFGTNSLLNIAGKTVAVKTGTTDDKRDNYAVGYTNDVTVGAWVGNNDNTPMNPVIASGVTGATPIWRQIMVELLKTYKDGIMDKPDNVIALQINGQLGGLPRDGFTTRSEYFIKGTEPKDVSPFFKKLKISRANGKLANEVEIRSGNYDEKEYIIISENDPVSSDGKNRWQEAIDEWARNQSDDRYKPPTETSSENSDSVAISFNSPSDHSTVNSSTVEVKARIGSSASIKNTKIFINGSEVRNLDGDRDDINENFNLSDGIYEIKIRAVNDKDRTGEASIHIGVNRPWDATPTPGGPTLSPTP